jgi:hypothetical protein
MPPWALNWYTPCDYEALRTGYITLIMDGEEEEFEDNVIEPELY